MKLVRLTNTTKETENSFINRNDTSLFDCNFNDGIEIEANSKIALISVAGEIGSSDISIGEANNGLTYEIKTGYNKTINLKNYTYNVGNSHLLLKDIQNKLNEDANWQVGLDKILGLEWFCDMNDSGKVLITYRIGISNSYIDAGSLNNWFDANIEVSDDFGEGFEDVYGQDSLEPATALYTKMAFFYHPLSRGNGYIRARINTLTHTGADNTSGYYIGLTRCEFDEEDDFLAKDINYGIRATIKADGTLEYYTSINGVDTLSATAPSPVVAEDEDNDYLEVAIDGNLIKFNVYKSDGSKTELLVGGVPYTAGEDLYPFVSFQASRNHGTIDSLRFTPSQEGDFLKSSVQLQPQSGTSAPPQQLDPIQITSNYIQFEDKDLANYIGYTSKRQPETGYKPARSGPRFRAQEVFTAGMEVKGFIIQLMNIKLDSYDAFKEQRENILAVIPNSYSAGNIVYTPPTPYFINMLNKEKLVLRNIKARILNSNYTNLQITGTGTITLLID